MSQLDRDTATAITFYNLPTFAVTNAYPLSRIKREVLFALAQRQVELSATDAPLVTDWINDAYRQILGMIETQTKNYSSTFVLPALVSTIKLPGPVDEVHNISSVIDGLITPLGKSVDIEYWRSLGSTTDLDLPLYNYFLYRDASGLMLQFHPQSIQTTLTIDMTVSPSNLVSDTDCPALEPPICLGLIELAISIAMRRLGEFTYAGVQNNAALAIIRSHIDKKAESRKGTVASITRPRSQTELRRNYGSQYNRPIQ